VVVAKLVSFSMLALIGLACIGDAHGSYSDCTVCHLDPLPDSPAKDYYEFFVDRKRQHVVAVDYPVSSSGYRQPTYIQAATANGGIKGSGRRTKATVSAEISLGAFFDSNGNGIADIDEVQLFGLTDKVECASCHREHGDTSPPAEPNMYLRIANSNSELCGVCHKL
jgi:hypothetical protein